LVLTATRPPSSISRRQRYSRSGTTPSHRGGDGNAVETVERFLDDPEILGGTASGGDVRRR